MKGFYKKIWTGLLVGIFGLIVFSAVAHAQLAQSTPSGIDWVSNPGTSAVTFVSYFINKTIGLLVSLGAWLIGLGLELDGSVFNSPTVQAGFSVALSIANLGFVLGIIIIAVATILRSETYGIKQMLWKLIVMAILVNFGLVITGPIVGLANNFAGYFLNASGGADNFTLYLTSAFSTSAFNQGPSITTAAANAGGADPCTTIDNFSFGGELSFATQSKADCEANWAAAKQADSSGANDFLKNLMSLVFSAIFMGITAFTLLLIGILLLVRYVYLSILLILLPLAWLTWIFPKFNYSSKWWGQFIKWAMFPALVLFFLYLAIQSVTVLSNNTLTVPQAQVALSSSPTKNPDTAIMSQTGQPSYGILALNEIVAIALVLGGLFAANSLSLTGSETIMHGAKWAGGQIRGAVVKQSKKGARLGYQKVGGEKITSSLRQGRIGGYIKKVPIVGGVVGGVVQRGESIAGRALGNISTNEAMVKEAQKNVPKDWEAAKQNLMGSMNTQDQFAHIALGVKEGRIKPDDMVNGKKVADFLDNKDLVARYGQGKLVDDANKLFFSDGNYRAAQKAMLTPEGQKAAAMEELLRSRVREESLSNGLSEAEAENEADKEVTRMKSERKLETIKVKVADDIKDEFDKVIFKAGDSASAQEVMKASQKNMLQKLSKADASKVDVNTLFGPKATQAEFETRLRSIAEFAPQIVPNLVKNMKSPALSRFTKNYEVKLDQLIEDYNARVKDLANDTSGKLEQAQMALTRMKAAKKSYTKIISGVYGSSASEGGKKEEKESGGEKDHK